MTAAARPRRAALGLLRQALRRLAFSGPEQPRACGRTRTLDAAPGGLGLRVRLPDSGGKLRVGGPEGSNLSPRL